MDLDYYIGVLRRLFETATDPADLISDAVGAGARVVAIGESHFPDNAARRFVASMVPRFSEIGISCLCLELPDSMQTFFERFVNDRNRQNLFDDLVSAGLDASLYSRDADFRVPENAFFEAIDACAEASIPVILIDETRSPDGRYIYRDETMANTIVQALRSHPAVLMFGGMKHIYARRTPKGNFRTALELLKEQDIHTFSMLGVVAQDEGNDNLTVVRATAGSTTSVAISTTSALQHVPFAIEARCAHASCDRWSIFHPQFLACRDCRRLMRPTAALEFVSFASFDSIASLK